MLSRYTKGVQMHHENRYTRMDERKRSRGGLALRFPASSVYEIKGTGKARIVLPAIDKRDSDQLFGVDENYVERDKLPASIEIDTSLIRTDKRNGSMRYTYLSQDKEYTIKWYGQGWETPAPISVPAEVVCQAFGMGKSRDRSEMKRKYPEHKVSRNQHGRMLYENESVRRYDEKPERPQPQQDAQAHNAQQERQAQPGNAGQQAKRVPIIFMSSQIVNRSLYSNKKLTEELSRLQAKPADTLSRYEQGRIDHLKGMLSQPPRMMYKIILPDAEHRKALQFKEDRFGIDRNSRIAYINVPENICHEDIGQKKAREAMRREKDILSAKRDRSPAEEKRLGQIENEFKKPVKMYFYVPETMTKGVEVHFEGVRTGTKGQDGKDIFDRPESYVIKDAHELRAGFGMGHYYTKEDRARMDAQKLAEQAQQKTAETQQMAAETKQKQRGFVSLLKDTFSGIGRTRPAAAKTTKGEER
jgi:hypothetical protein